MKILKRTLLLFCVIFTIATILSSSLQLAMGTLEDTNIHILDRAVLTLMGSFVVVLGTQYPFKKKIYKFVILYVIFISLAMIYVWICGFWQELHPSAYRDVFFNDTIAYIVVLGVMEIYNKFKNRKSPTNN